MKTCITYLILVTYLLIIVTACQNQESADQNGLVQIDISDPGKPSDVSLSELGISEIQYIPLETNSKSLINAIQNNKLLLTQSGIYVDVSSTNGKALLRFSPEGDFICQIGTQGSGPNEYELFSDFTIDEKNNLAFILSQWQDKICVYDLSGEFIETIPCPENSSKINCVNGYLLCYSSNQTGIIENSFDLIDYDGNVIKSYPNKYLYEAGTIPVFEINECFFYWKDGYLHVKETHSDTIFIFDDTEFIPHCILFRGDKRYSTELRKVSSTQEGKLVGEKRFGYIIEQKLLEAGDLIYSEFGYNKGYHEYVAWIKEGEQFFRTFDNGIINDIDGGPNVYFKTVLDDSTIVCWINAIELKEYVASASFKNVSPLFPEKKSQLEKLAASLSENHNPVVMLLKLNTN